jgi:D-glycero-alpha-D-manno-heptose 1-phosphate guanylyltransferase
MEGLAGVTAAILAGGLGTRLRSMVWDRPKVLAQIKGKPFLSFLLDQLVAASVKKVVLCTGHLGEQVRSTFGQSYNGLELNYSQETVPLGTGGALRLALPFLASEPVLVMNGDSYSEMNLDEFLNWHLALGGKASLALAEVGNTERFGQVLVDRHGAVIRFEEKAGNTGRGWVNAGIYLMSQEVLLSIPPMSQVSLEREVLRAWIGRGLFGFRNKGRFIDIGTPEAYGTAELFFSS